MKRAVTQEELDSLYQVLRPFREAIQGVSETIQLALPTDGNAAAEVVGVHVGGERTNILFLNSKRQIVKHLPVNHGYESIDKLLEGLEKNLAEAKKAKLPVHFTLSGKPSHFVLAKLPRLPRPQAVKAFRVQLKQSSGEDWDDVRDIAINAGKKGQSADGQMEYFVGALQKGIIEKIARPLKRNKHRIVTWDFDLLCLARAANFVWNRAKLESATRLLVLLDWDHCYLMILGADGKLVAPRLPIGINSFLDRLLQTRVPPPVDSQDSPVLGANTVEVRERRVLANQAIHDVYVPLGQQLKTQLFSGCNENGIPLPTHFCLVSVGATLFRITESLSADLGLRALPVEQLVPVETVAALGATLTEKTDLKVNLMPAGSEEAMRNLKDSFRNFRNLTSNLKKLRPTTKISLGATLDRFSFVNPKVAFAFVGVILVCGAIAYPMYSRMQTTKELQEKKRELATLGPLKDFISKARSKEALADKKMNMVKIIEGKSWQMSHALKEMFSVLPAQVQLKSLSYRDSTLNLKGLADGPETVQEFLKSALTLQLLTDPTPVKISRKDKNVEFELTFRFRPR